MTFYILQIRALRISLLCSLLNELDCHSSKLLLASYCDSVAYLYTNLDLWSFRFEELFWEEDFFFGFGFVLVICLLVLNGTTLISPPVPQKKKFL